MAGNQEHFGEGWGNMVAKWTFVFTVIGAALFVAAVFYFIL